MILCVLVIIIFYNFSIFIMGKMCKNKGCICFISIFVMVLKDEYVIKKYY